MGCRREGNGCRASGAEASPGEEILATTKRIAPAVLAALVACAPPAPDGPVMPPSDARQELEQVAAANRLERPTQLFFDWSAREPDFRGSGQGVARLEPPDRARLDLFLDNGEQVAEAVLIGDDLHIPPWVEVGMIPPPPLLWASLAVFRPGPAAELVEVRGLSQLAVDYRLPDGTRLRFHVEGRRVVGASVLDGDDVVRTLVVAETDPGSRFPSEATYRDVPDFRQLEVDLSSVEYVESFPPDIWSVVQR